MKKKYRLKKSAITFLVIFIFLIALIISLFSSKSYSVEYNIFDYDISENYDKDKQTYYFEITKNDITYPFIYESEYQKERKIIKDIKEYKEDDYTCLRIDGSLIKAYPLCSYKDEIIEEDEKESNKYTDIFYSVFSQLSRSFIYFSTKCIISPSFPLTPSAPFSPSK